MNLAESRLAHMMTKTKPKIYALLIGLVIVLVGMGFYLWMTGTKAYKVDQEEQMKKFETYARPESFISASGLNNLMNSDTKPVVIGALNPLRGETPIKGSYSLWRDDYSSDEETYGFEGMRNQSEEMAQILSEFGASKDTTIVVYAANDHHDAARLWWQIKLLGHEDVRYLDGGLNAWSGEGYPLGRVKRPDQASDYKAVRSDDALIGSFQDVVEAIDGKGVLLDVRSEDEVMGKETKGGAFGPGKIPGSLWMEWTLAVDDQGLIKPYSELEGIYDQILSEEIVVYCQSGVRSAHTMFVLTQALGLDRVKNYDGSWIEWSYEHYEKANPKAVIENGQ